MRRDDPDETEGRAIYRAIAQKLATSAMNLKRVSYLKKSKARKPKAEQDPTDDE